MFGRSFAGRGQRGGMGLGFRGSSPPWPYVGLGRGGLPRCGYFFSRVGTPIPPLYPASPFYPRARAVPGYIPYSPRMTRDEELNYLKDEAEAIKGQLEEIESRMRDLEAKQ
jgi:hypothetical protein